MIDLLAGLWARVDDRTVMVIKCGVAVAATLVLSWYLGSSREGPRSKRVRDWLLAALGVLALGSWWEFGHFHYPDYLQIHEHYHYYLGAKYFPELGYTRLYECTVAADVEAGLRQQDSKLWIRDLNTNQLTKGDAVIRNAVDCKAHFTSARWGMFTQDVAWFRAHRSPERWAEVLLDHGYNGTPVWATAATLLIPNRPATDTDILGLALIDPLLILVMWAFVWWAFGWRTMCIGMIWWGTNDLATYLFTGGAMLRADWLALSAIGVCLVKKGRPAAGGAALTYAALLRIFPGFILVGLGLKAAVNMWRQRSLRLDTAHRAFLIGCASAALILMTLSFVVVGRGMSGGVDAWEGFVANSRKHLSTPLTNNMGLKTALSFAPSSRSAEVGAFWLDTPWDTWAAARHRVFQEREPVYWVLVVAFVAVLARAVAAQEDWVALALGTTLVPIATELTCYYYAIFLLFAFLWSKWEWTGAALSALSAVSLLVPVLFRFADDAYTVSSVAVVLYVGTIVAGIVLPTRPTEFVSSANRTANANAGYPNAVKTERSF